MTREEFNEDFDQFIHTLKIVTTKLLPYKTGNLSRNAYKIIRTEYGYKLFIDKAVAYYVVYLDKNNIKHYDYLKWDELVDFINEQIQNRYGG